MRNTRSHKSQKKRSNKSPDQWANRHREQHNAAKAGRSTALDVRVTRRFSVEFENALRQRGQHAANAARNPFDEHDIYAPIAHLILTVEDTSAVALRAA